MMLGLKAKLFSHSLIMPENLISHSLRDLLGLHKGQGDEGPVFNLFQSDAASLTPELLSGSIRKGRVQHEGIYSFLLVTLHYTFCNYSRSAVIVYKEKKKRCFFNPIIRIQNTRA